MIDSVIKQEVMCYQEIKCECKVMFPPQEPKEPLRKSYVVTEELSGSCGLLLFVLLPLAEVL